MPQSVLRIDDSELCELYGVVSSLQPKAVDELRRAYQQEGTETQCVWMEQTAPTATVRSGPRHDNPYRPTGVPPRDAGVMRDHRLLRAAVSTDDETLRWFAQSYASETWHSPLAGFLVVIVATTVGIVLQLHPSWVAMAAVVASMIAVNRVTHRWQSRRIERNFQSEPFRSEAYFWVTVRCHTLTIANESRIETWAMSEVFAKAKTHELIVFELEPGRILYLPSNAWTTPENFAEFRAGVLRRLRRYRWSHFWTLRI